MADPRVRNIKIKTGVVNRLTKEKVYYEKESVNIEEKIQKMKDNKEDEYNIKKKGELFDESKSMICDAEKRLRVAIEDLQNVLDVEKELSEVEEYVNAKTAIEAGNKEINKNKEQQQA
ncbi:hypothetical protein ACF0H5_013073 [Mactra antiquata]